MSGASVSLFSAFVLLLFGGAAINSKVYAAAVAYPAPRFPIRLLE